MGKSLKTGVSEPHSVTSPFQTLKKNFASKKNAREKTKAKNESASQPAENQSRESSPAILPCTECGSQKFWFDRFDRGPHCWQCRKPSNPRLLSRVIDLERGIDKPYTPKQGTSPAQTADDWREYEIAGYHVIENAKYSSPAIREAMESF